MNITIPTYIQSTTLLQCINIIIQTYAKNEDLICTNQFFESLNFPSIKTDYDNEISLKYFPTQPDFYIIQENDEAKLKTILDMLGNVSSPTFKPRGKFVFLSHNFSQEIIVKVASFYILDVIFIDVEKNEISTYFPYTQRTLNEVNTTLNGLGKCRDVSKIELFPTKVPQSWQNSTVMISFRYYDAYSMCASCLEKGIDIDIFDIILNHTNIKGIYSVTPDKTDLSFCTRFEVFIGNYGPKYGSIPFGEFSMSYTEDAVVWIAPAPQPIPRWMYFLEIFDRKVWIACFSVICVISFTWSLAKWIIHEISIRELLTVPISTFCTFLGQNFTFRTVLISHRILIIFIIFLSVLMNFFFATRLTYLLNGLNIGNNINSLDDAVHNKLIFGCPKSLVPIFNNTKKRAEHLQNYFYDCDSSPKCVTRAAVVRDMVVCRTIRRTRFLKSLVNSQTGKWMVTELYPPIYVKQVVAFFRRGLPVSSLFNRHIFYLVESGIMNRIIKKYEKFSEVEDLSTTVRKLQLEHLVAPLFLWLFGLLLAVSVFFVEKLLMNKQ